MVESIMFRTITPLETLCGRIFYASNNDDYLPAMYRNVKIAIDQNLNSFITLLIFIFCLTYLKELNGFHIFIEIRIFEINEVC